MSLEHGHNASERTYHGTESLITFKMITRLLTSADYDGLVVISHPNIPSVFLAGKHALENILARIDSESLNRNRTGKRGPLVIESAKGREESGQGSIVASVESQFVGILSVRLDHLHGVVLEVTQQTTNSKSTILLALTVTPEPLLYIR